MHFKQLWINFSFLGHLRLAKDRITVSRLTLGYLVFSLVHCIIQVALQARVFVLNHDHAEFLSDILEVANLRQTDTYPLIDHAIHLCPSDETQDSCFPVWDGTPQVNFMGTNAAAAAASAPNPSTTSSSSLTSSTSTAATTDAITATATATATRVADDLFDPTPTGSQVDSEDSASDSEDGFDSDERRPPPPQGPPSGPRPGPPGNAGAPQARALAARQQDAQGDFYTVMSRDGPAVLSHACVSSLNYPLFALERTEREDAALIIFHFWVLGMSVVALLNESIPHMVASFVTHVLSTAWAAFQLLHTQHFRMDYHYAIADGACAGGPRFLSSYWATRLQNEIPALALNCVALLVSVVLTFFLIRSFGWKTFKRIGASIKMNRLYKVVFVFCIGLQLSTFFITITVGVWLDQLWNGVPKSLADHKVTYQAVGIVTVILIGPWAYTGWTSARKELRTSMAIFLGLSTLYVASWTLLLLSHTFRWMMRDWPFFTIMTSLSLFLTLVSALMAVWVRINFGKGLIYYMNQTEDLPQSKFDYVGHSAEEGRVQWTSFDGARSSMEKIDFPRPDSTLEQYPSSPVKEIARPPAAKVSTASKSKFMNLAALTNVARYQSIFRSKDTSATSPIAEPSSSYRIPIEINVSTEVYAPPRTPRASTRKTLLLGLGGRIGSRMGSGSSRPSTARSSRSKRSEQV